MLLDKEKQKNHDRPHISIVVPLLDEEESLPELHEKLTAVLNGMKKSYEIIFVDDGSTDNSYGVLKQLFEKDRQIRVIRFRKNYGKAAALACGFEAAQGDIVITMDADLQDDPEEIPQLIGKIEQGYDLVSGWKKKRFDPLVKRTTSKFYNIVTSRISGIRLHDFNCGLKAYRQNVVKEIQIYGQLHRFIPVLAHWQGFRVAELVVQHHPRKYGKTKFGLSRFTAGLLDLFTVVFLHRFKKRPLHLFGSIGLFSFFIGVLLNLYLAYQRIFADKYLSNRPLLFLAIMMVIVGVQFVSIGLLGEMITETQKRKNDYSIKDILQ